MEAQAASLPKMLVVDDTPSIRLMVTKLFQDSYQVADAEDGVCALELLQDYEPDIILTDLEMPRLDGFGLCEQLFSDPRWKDIPVVIISRYDQESNRVRGIEIGAVDFIPKPFSFQELKVKVDAILKRSRERRRLREQLADISNVLKRKEDLLDMSREDLIESNKKLQGFVKELAEATTHKERLYQELRKLYLDVIAALINTLEARDRYTRGHSQRVARFARKIATALRLDESTVELVERAALMHDIGKIGVADSILNKPESLDCEEYELIKLHPGDGADILGPINFLEEILPVIRHHHERYDGSGYPSGLRSGTIPLAARIIAVADSYEAMTSDRPYRAGRPHEEAVGEIRNCSGAQFDPEIVDVVLENADSIFLSVRPAAQGR